MVFLGLLGCTDTSNPSEETKQIPVSDPPVQSTEDVATVGAIDISTDPIAALSNVPTEGICPGCDVVVISVCSLRRDYVGAYGEKDIETPNIDTIAAQSMRFDQAYSTSSFTFASLSSVVTGRFGSATGVVRWGTGLNEQVKTLPEIMGYYGYATGAFSIDAASGFRPEYGIQRGFQRISVIDPPRDTPDGRLETGEPGPGGDSARPAVEWIGAQPTERPLFVMFHSRSAHYPFVVQEASAAEDPSGVLRALWKADLDHETPQDAPGSGGGKGATIEVTPIDQLHQTMWRSGEEGPKALRQAYKESVERMDIDVGLILKAIEERGRKNKTVIVLLADHGESLYDHNELLHGGSYFDPVVHIPLLVSVPGYPAGLTNSLVSQVDITPTILEIIGGTPPAKIDGSSMVPILKDSTEMIRQTTIIEGNPSMQASDQLSGAVVSPPWVAMRQPTPCEGLINPLQPPSPSEEGPPPSGPPPSMQGLGNGPFPQNGEMGPPGLPGPDGKPVMNGNPSMAPQEETPLHTCLFHLVNDPKQQRNVASENPKVLEQLLSRWDGYRAAVRGESIPKQLTFDPAFLELLQRTGYDFKPLE